MQSVSFHSLGKLIFNDKYSDVTRSIRVVQENIHSAIRYGALSRQFCIMYNISRCAGVYSVQ